MFRKELGHDWLKMPMIGDDKEQISAYMVKD